MTPSLIEKSIRVNASQESRRVEAEFPPVNHGFAVNHRSGGVGRPVAAISSGGEEGDARLAGQFQRRRQGQVLASPAQAVAPHLHSRFAAKEETEGPGD